MHVGYMAFIQNPEKRLSDREVYRHEIRLAEQVESLGFDSIWTTEHHFTDYLLTPDVLQFLAYMAGATKTVRLGSAVVVLPWHDPIRVAEQVSMLDHLSNGGSFWAWAGDWGASSSKDSVSRWTSPGSGSPNPWR